MITVEVRCEKRHDMILSMFAQSIFVHVSPIKILLAPTYILIKTQGQTCANMGKEIDFCPLVHFVPPLSSANN